jgi:L-threonylcarbamoyladenylate synthase
LLTGNLVVFPTETVYGLGADATNEDAVRRLYKVKGRPSDHPLIVHVSSVSSIFKWAKEIPDYALKLALAFWPGPMTLLLSRSDLAHDYITGGQEIVGLRVPANVSAHKLLKNFEAKGGLGVAAPSANRFGKVSPTSVEHVKSKLLDYLNTSDVILDGGSTLIGIESTIVDCTGAEPAIIRPGAITSTMLQATLENLATHTDKLNTQKIKAPGLLSSHYRPDAALYINGDPKPGDGFLAMDTFPTPAGVIRLASPSNNCEYARILYDALHSADNMGLSRVIIVPPIGGEMSDAILDRIQKSAHKTF